MAKVMLICGKICSGKTTYAQRLRREHRAVLLSCDEITLALFDQHIGEQHDVIVERTQNYLFNKSLEILKSGINVILDWGFWMHEERDLAREFYRSHEIDCEFHYVDVSNAVWQANLIKRNRAILDKQTSAYYVDEGLARKFEKLFEMPSRDEINVWFQNDWI